MAIINIIDNSLIASSGSGSGGGTVIKGIEAQIVPVLPQNPAKNTFYLVGNDTDGYSLYYIDKTGYEAKVSNFDIDLSTYIQETQLDNITLLMNQQNKVISAIPIVNVNALPESNINENIFYKLATTTEGTTTYSIYFRLNGEWKQIGENLGDIDYESMVINRPKINNVELIGNKTTAQLLLSYVDLLNKPSINSVELTGNKTTADLNISYNDINDKPKLCNVVLQSNKVLTDIINSPDNTIIIGDNSIQVSNVIFYTKSQVDNLVAGISSTYIVASLPQSPANNTYYLVGNDNDGYILYYYDTQGNRAEVGSYTLDLNDYLKYTNIDGQTITWDATNKQISSKAIIDVEELPTTSIKSNVLYRYSGVCYQYVNNTWKKIGGAIEVEEITIQANKTGYSFTNKLEKNNVIIQLILPNGSSAEANYTITTSTITIWFSADAVASYVGSVIKVVYC